MGLRMTGAEIYQAFGLLYFEHKISLSPHTKFPRKMSTLTLATVPQHPRQAKHPQTVRQLSALNSTCPPRKRRFRYTIAATSDSGEKQQRRVTCRSHAVSAASAGCCRASLRRQTKGSKIRGKMSNKRHCFVS